MKLPTSMVMIHFDTPQKTKYSTKKKKKKDKFEIAS